MRNNWKLCTFYTKNTPYEEVYKKYFLASCKKLNLDTTAYPIQSKHTWLKNTSLKPTVILNALNSENFDVIFLDADAEILKYPELFDEIPQNIDIAYHELSWKEWYGYDKETKEILSGTLFIRNNQKMRNFCEEWKNEAEKSNEWEQKILQQLLRRNSLEINSYLLPIEYCYIVSRPGGLKPLINCEPVILHHQVSRILRKKIS